MIKANQEYNDINLISLISFLSLAFIIRAALPQLFHLQCSPSIRKESLILDLFWPVAAGKYAEFSTTLKKGSSAYYWPSGG